LTEPPRPLLDVQGLTISFATEAGPVTTVHDVSFSVGEGEIVAIVGESGSGKTLSLLSVLGLADARNMTVEGIALFRGKRLFELTRREMRRILGAEIGFISQDPLTSLTPVFTIGDQIVEQILEHERVSRRAARTRAVDLLAEVGIANPKEAFNRYPHQLSGGMRQRAVIAMAVSCGPSLIVADEPTTALDVTVQAQVLDLLRRLRREFGSSIVLITHDLGVVAEMAERVLVMYAGRIVERADTRSIFSDPWHPYTWGLLNSIPPIHGPRPARLVSIPGTPPTPDTIPPGCAFAPRCAARFEPCGSRPPRRRGEARDALCFLDGEARNAARARLWIGESEPA
jgi:peptide/nickel transport system ATP-binding protein